MPATPGVEEIQMLETHAGKDECFFSGKFIIGNWHCNWISAIPYHCYVLTKQIKQYIILESQTLVSEDPDEHLITRDTASTSSAASDGMNAEDSTMG